MRCVLHIGLEKTGTTSIQSILWRHRRQLSAKGVLYPASLGSLNHSKLEAYAQDDCKGGDIRRNLGLSSPADVASFRRDLERDFEAEAARGDYDLLLVCNENLSSHLVGTDEIARVRSFLLRHCGEVDVHVYLRRQSEAYTAAASTAAKAGTLRDLSSLERPDYDSPAFRARYDYLALLDRWSAVFGAQAMHVHVYHRSLLRNADAAEDFFAAVPLDFLYDSRTRLNMSLGRLKLEFLARLNRSLPHDGSRRDRALRDEIVHAVESVPLEDEPLRPAVGRRLDERFRDSNAAVARRYFGRRELFPPPDDMVAAQPSDESDKAGFLRIYEAVTRLRQVKTLMAMNRMALGVERPDLAALISRTLRMLDACPRSDDLWAHLGQLHCRAGQHGLAAKAYANAVEYKPGRAGHHARLSMARLAAGDVRGALDGIRRAIELEGDNAYFHYHHATLCRAVKDMDGMRRSLDLAMALEPTEPAFREARRALADGSGEEPAAATAIMDTISMR